MISSDQRAKFSCVDDEEEWSEDRTLWNTAVEGHHIEHTVVYLVDKM